VLSDALQDTIASSEILRNQLDKRDKLYLQTQKMSDDQLKSLHNEIQVEKIRNELAKQELKFQSSRPVQYVMHQSQDTAADLENLTHVARKNTDIKDLSGPDSKLAFDYQFGKKHDQSYTHASAPEVIVL
jgi:hypothetical protein